jgi:hypothetical protein
MRMTIGKKERATLTGIGEALTAALERTREAQLAGMERESVPFLCELASVAADLAGHLKELSIDQLRAHVTPMEIRDEDARRANAPDDDGGAWRRASSG